MLNTILLVIILIICASIWQNTHRIFRKQCEHKRAALVPPTDDTAAAATESLRSRGFLSDSQLTRANAGY